VLAWVSSRCALGKSSANDGAEREFLSPENGAVNSRAIVACAGVLMWSGALADSEIW